MNTENNTEKQIIRELEVALTDAVTHSDETGKGQLYAPAFGTVTYIMECQKGIVANWLIKQWREKYEAQAAHNKEANKLSQQVVTWEKDLQKSEKRREVCQKDVSLLKEIKGNLEKQTALLIEVHDIKDKKIGKLKQKNENLATQVRDLLAENTAEAARAEFWRNDAVAVRKMLG